MNTQRIPSLHDFISNDTNEASEIRQLDISGSADAIVLKFDSQISKQNTIILTEMINKYNLDMVFKKDNMMVISCGKSSPDQLAKFKKELSL